MYRFIFCGIVVWCGMFLMGGGGGGGLKYGGRFFGVVVRKEK